jgi:hypothetical protein
MSERRLSPRLEDARAAHRTAEAQSNWLSVRFGEGYRGIDKSSKRIVWSSSMRGGTQPLADLHQDLHETDGFIGILEKASRELKIIIDWDESVRPDPQRGRQLTSIAEQLAIARVKRTVLARRIERLQTKPKA